MKRIGITGQNGFVGSYLYNTLGLHQEEFERIDFSKDFFVNQDLLDDFVAKCDVIVHLAAMNRHESQEFIYQTNIDLVRKLTESLERANSQAHIIFSSSSQEERDNCYGKSKKEGRKLFINWADKSGGKFSGLVIPNVFGPFGKPFYNSFIATFCHQLTRYETPTIVHDGTVNLIYINQLVEEILKQIRANESEYFCQIPSTSAVRVSEVLELLNLYKEQYFERGEIPVLSSDFELNLFNTFRCYIDHQNYYPVKFTQHTDPRGSFVEVIRLGVGGQVSFSTTLPGITRGNHFHTRKVERFAVIKGKALIQLRRIGTDEVFNFELDGNEPSYVDMPIWYTHNIKNIGDEILYTNFWINETYNPNDPDTYFETV